MTKLFLTISVIFAIGSQSKIIKNEKLSWYTYNQAIEGKCTNDYQCDGLRICSFQKVCIGQARPLKDKNYEYYQDGTGCPNYSQQQNFKNRDYFCNGNRICSQSGTCVDLQRSLLTKG